MGEEEVPVTMLPTCYHIDIGVVKFFNLKPQLIDKPPDRLEGRGGFPSGSPLHVPVIDQ